MAIWRVNLYPTSRHRHPWEPPPPHLLAAAPFQDPQSPPTLVAAPLQRDTSSCLWSHSISLIPLLIRAGRKCFVSCWPYERIYSSTTTLASPLKAVKYTEVHKISKKSTPVHTSSTNDSPIITKKTLPSHSNSSSSLQNSPTSHEYSPSYLRNRSSTNRQLGKSASSSRLPLPVSTAVKKAWYWFFHHIQGHAGFEVVFVTTISPFFVFSDKLIPTWSAAFDL